MKTWNRMPLGWKIACITCGMLFLGVVVNRATPAKQKEKPEKEQPAKIEPTYTSISAINLWNAYQDNKLSADLSYKKQHLEVRGVICQIGKVWGTPFVVLAHDNNPLSLMGVHCDFSDDSPLLSLSVGQAVTIRGLCTGKAISVSMKKCSLCG
jgi:hypothetical protein